MAYLVAILATLLAATTPASAASIRSQQWYLDALHIPQAQEISTGRGVTVAVIDSGVDGGHPDLKGQITGGKCLQGFDDVQKPTEDLDGHGTAMAGIIAAKGNGQDHALGVAPDAKIMPICMLTDDSAPGPAIRAIGEGIRWATDHGATVVSISLGSDHSVMSSDMEAIKSAVAYAQGHNVVIVAATGNLPDAKHVITPAALPGVVAVAGTTKSGAAWKGATTGKQVALSAPATGIVSTDTLGRAHDLHPTGYRTGTGTSDATAIVSGVAALVRAKYPKLDAANVINRLIRTADHKGAAGRNDQYGYGIVDPVKALTADVPTVHGNPLGQLAAASASPSASSAGGHGAAAPSTGGGSALPWIIAVVVAIVLAAVVVIVVATQRRRRSF
ncbi:type VII secretion-associated serine protease mycosin [Actinocatenispora thailandica]|nr:type VII secretion-associated serine protease mycosin [Actinocatenispora thailandica]